MGMERRREGQWLVGSKWNDYAKGFVTGRWVAAVEGVEFGGGGRGASTVVSNQSIVEWRRRWGWSGAEGGEG